MGCYDTFVDGDREGQIKFFYNSLCVYLVGDRVPNQGTFSIAMREGGFVNISAGIFDSWTDTAKHLFIFDKWGAQWYGEDTNKGIMGEHYRFQPPPEAPQ